MIFVCAYEYADRIRVDATVLSPGDARSRQLDTTVLPRLGPWTEDELAYEVFAVLARRALMRVDAQPPLPL